MKNKFTMFIKINFQKNNINVEFVAIFYYTIVNKMDEKLICFKYYRKLTFDNLLHIHFKSKFYRRKIIKFKKLSKNKKLTYKLIIIKVLFIMRELKLIKLITFFLSLNEIFFHF